MTLLSSKWDKLELEQLENCPQEQARIFFGDTEITELGQVITPTQAQNPPSVKWKVRSPCSWYAIFMMDPDAPSRKNPAKREWYHWSVINIPGNEIKKGETVAEYVGAGPPEKTGLHRYVILVYEQPGKLKSVHPYLKVAPHNRDCQRVKNFASLYKLGPPIAGGCFQAEYDAYVDKLLVKLFK